MQDPWEGSQRQTPMRAQRRNASPTSAGDHPRFSRAQGVTRRDTDDSYVLSRPTSGSAGNSGDVGAGRRPGWAAGNYPCP